MLLFFQHHYPLKIQIKFFQEFQCINYSRQYGRQTSLLIFYLVLVMLSFVLSIISILIRNVVVFTASLIPNNLNKVFLLISIDKLFTAIWSPNFFVTFSHFNVIQ